MRGLLNKVSDQLKVRHTLDCIAADTNNLNINIFMRNTGNQISQLQNANQKFCNVYASQKANANPVHLYIPLTETVALILN